MVPGMRFHIEAVDTALRLAAHGEGADSAGGTARPLSHGLDALLRVRLGVVETAATQASAGLSGRLLASLPAVEAAVRRFGVERAWFINPDRADLDTTRQWANALSLSRRCHFSAEPIESAALDGERFDAITSISVFEHRRRTARARERPAPSGTRRVALADIALHGGWLRPVRDYDEYNLARPDSEGRFTGAFCDVSSLRERVLSILGEPSQMTVYGESEPGYFGRNAQQKMKGLPYPFWRVHDGPPLSDLFFDRRPTRRGSHSAGV